MPWATAASKSAMPSVAIAGTAKHLVARPQHPAERLAPLVERLRQQRSTVEHEQVEGEERGRPTGVARQPARQSARRRPARRRRRPRARHRGSPSARRRGRRARPVRGAPPCDRRRRRPRSGRLRSPAARPDRSTQRPLAAPPRLEQVLGRIERLGRGRGSIGRRSGRSGSLSASRRSESWSAIVARW